ENGHFVIGNYLTSLTLTAVYHTIRTTASKDIDLSSSGRPHQVFFNLLSGDHDLLVPFLATQDWMRSLNYSIVEDWRPWMVHNQVAGYTRTYANKMTFATGGGHTIVYKPDEYSAMFKRWINGQPL
ncbi:unnamed protein product, partial [Brassica rapa subsp. narinosa]